MSKFFEKENIDVARVLNGLIDTVGDLQFAKQAGFKCQKPLAQQIVNKEQQSIQQLITAYPAKSLKNKEEIRPKNSIIDSIRPFSAKVYQRSQQKKKQKTFNPKLIKQISFPRYQNCQKEGNGFNFRKNRLHDNRGSRKHIQKSITEQNQLIALNSNIQEYDEFDFVIEKLRKVKEEKQKYQRSKENFIKQIENQKQEFMKAQAKIAANLTKKQFTYSFAGNIMEMNKGRNLVKKKSRNIQMMRNTDQLAKKYEDKCEQIRVVWPQEDKKQRERKTIFRQSQSQEVGKFIGIENNMFKLHMIKEN